MVVRQEGGLFTGRAPDEGGKGLLVPEPDPYGQGVDEQSHHRLGPGQFGGPPGDGGPRHHVLTPGHVGEDE